MTSINSINEPTKSASTRTDQVARSTGQEFAQMMSSVMSDTVTALQAAETTSTKALSGEASIQQVVESIMHAERQLQTVLAVRDKVVAAYLEISRTNI